MASPMAIVASIISVVAGFLTFKHLTEVVDPFMKPIMESCPAEVEANPIVGFKPVDAFLCMIVAFFEKGRLNPAITLVGGYIIVIVSVVNTLITVEASRKRAPMFLTWLPLIFVAEIILGISVAVPLLWVPAYVLFNAGDRSSKPALEAKAIPVNRVVVMAVNSFIALPALLATGFLEGPRFKALLVVLQILPLVQPVFMWPVYGSTKNQAAGHKAVQLLHFFSAGVAFFFHALAIALVASDPSLFYKTIDLFTNHSGTDSLTYFLLIDALVTMGAALYFVLLEEGAVAFLVTTVGSVALGPAALALYFAYREGAIASAVVGAGSKKKSQ